MEKLSGLAKSPEHPSMGELRIAPFAVVVEYFRAQLLKLQPRKSENGYGK